MKERNWHKIITNKKHWGNLLRSKWNLLYNYRSFLLILLLQQKHCSKLKVVSPLITNFKKSYKRCSCPNCFQKKSYSNNNFLDLLSYDIFFLYKALIYFSTYKFFLIWRNPPRKHCGNFWVTLKMEFTFRWIVNGFNCRSDLFLVFSIWCRKLLHNTPHERIDCSSFLVQLYFYFLLFFE